MCGVGGALYSPVMPNTQDSLPRNPSIISPSPPAHVFPRSQAIPTRPSWVNCGRPSMRSRTPDHIIIHTVLVSIMHHYFSFLFVWKVLFLVHYYFVWCFSTLRPRAGFLTSTYYVNFQHAHFIPIIVGVGKGGAYYLVHGDLPRQHSFGTTLRFTGLVPADSRQ